MSGAKLTVSGLVLALCCIADLVVVRPAWTGRRIVEGQVRRGYFERFGDAVGLAVDDAIRSVFPSCVLTGDGKLAVPPGMAAVVPLLPGAEYDLTVESARAPYVVIGAEAPLGESDYPVRLPGEARFTGGRTLALQEGRLGLVPWDPTRPWREDAARLSALGSGCAAQDGALKLDARTADDGRLEINLGRCSLAERLPSLSDPRPLLAALAGPEWITVARRPEWSGKRWVVWQVLVLVVAKVAATWWAFGLPSAVAVSAALAGASLFVPVAATLTWPLMLLAGVAAAALRAGVLLLRRLPRRWRVPAVLVVVALASGVWALEPKEPRSFPPIMRTHPDGQPDACAVIGYSTAGGASLRGADLQQGRLGLRWFIDRSCARCREKTGALFAGGETLGWAKDAYCASPPSFGADGQLVFFGGANDDFLWGLLTVARLFIVGEQGPEPWRRSQAPAAAASLARIDAQTAALDDLMRCARSRRARFLFLHDFLVTDLVAGRDPDRAAMLAQRRAAVEAAGGAFVDLLDAFGAESGIAWFNDYVHPSVIAHERFAELACRLFP
jgi:hypothetical protein